MTTQVKSKITAQHTVAKSDEKKTKCYYISQRWKEELGDLLSMKFPNHLMQSIKQIAEAIKGIFLFKSNEYVMGNKTRLEVSRSLNKKTYKK